MARPMKLWRTICVGALLSLAASGCGAEDNGPAAGAGSGAAGAGAGGAQGGTAGSGGAGGLAGAAGGGAGSGGIGGRAGAGGASWACESRVSIRCSLEALCNMEGSPPCGAATSAFDADGCPRETCLSDDACDEGRTCVIQSMLRAGCFAGYVETCDMGPDSACSCTVSADCYPGGRCVTDPPAERCTIPTSCDALSSKIYGLKYSQEQLSGDALAQVEACLAAHEARAVELSCAD